MLPWNYGFHWTPGTIVFLGAFYTVLVIILTTLAKAAFRSWRDLQTQKVDAIRWRGDFHDLPARDRVCRHQLTGEVLERRCPHALDCRVCELPATLPSRPVQIVETEIFGMPFPADRFYHRGHTWAKPDADGTMTVGLDELGRRLIGRPDRVELPAAGTHLRVNATAWRAEKRGARVRVLAPVDGEVVATGGPEDDWYVKVKPLDGQFDIRHLLGPADVKPWIMRELERLQLMLGKDAPTLADGGVPVADISEAYPVGDWDWVCGEMFLEP